jgi:TolB-like protein/Tfp pilus assembly protein PilF
MGTVLSFGEFVLDAEAGSLTRLGIAVPLSFRGVKLLAALAGRAGEVVSKSDLLDAAWPGLAVEEGNLTVQMATLRRLLGPAADGGEWIATVPRVGYRFVGKVTQGAPGQRPAEPGPSIAVLPFVDLGADQAHQYFGDGLAEDVTTGLARLRWLTVAARNASFTMRGSTPVEVGRALGVRYMLAGSVRASQSRLRVRAELSDCADGRQAWAEQYDVPHGDFLDLQDRIAGSVLAQIEPRLYAAEFDRVRTRSHQNLDAWGLVMRAMPGHWPSGDGMESTASEALLRQALVLEPGHPRALALLALIEAGDVLTGRVDARGRLEAGLEHARGAIAADPADAWGHIAAGLVGMASRDTLAAIVAFGEALVLNSSLTIAHSMLGTVHGYAGQPEDGMHQIALAMALNPPGFVSAANHSTAGLIHFMEGRYGEAVEAQRRAVALQPRFGTAWRTLAASAGCAGDLGTAREALAQARWLQPTLSLDWIERFHPIVRAADRARYAGGLAAAGLS